ncbi:hypothetical protein [Streptomyces sp. NPDC059786]|uniref:hypothetical protein n=1 Tax=Streptomyces sp. NPDC059786 TaxID=3346946 RepID=UPI0036518B5E
MTSESRADGESEFAPNMSRAEMVEAWRARRRERRVQPSAAEGRSGVDGFTLRRWRRAGVFGVEAVGRVHALLETLLKGDPARREVPEWAVDTLQRCRADEPGPDLLAAVRAVLETAGPDDTAHVMTVVHEAGLPWLGPVGQQRLDHLMDPDGTTLEGDAHPTASEDTSGAFALYCALRTGHLSALAPSVCSRVLPWAPLGVVDDLIDAGAVTRRQGPWRLRVSEHDQHYLLARLSPVHVTPEAARAIGWRDAVERQRFLEGQEIEPVEGGLYDLLLRAVDGDTSVLRELEHLAPRELVLRLRHIQDGAPTGNWEPDILADRGLWRLLSALWEPKVAVVPRRSDFHALTALRYAYDLICRGEFKKARAQVDKLVEHEEGDSRQLVEAWNMGAYLRLLEEDLDNALIALSSIADRHPGAASNRGLIERRRDVSRNDRPHPSNPYLELGLPTGSPVWKQRYRDLRREFVDHRDEAARLNRAMRRIQQAEQGEDWSAFFTLPLDQSTFDLPYAVPVTLVPPVEPMPRHTVPSDPSDLDVVRRRALADLLPTFLNAPRRPDHQHRTTV